jgi:filamentous hemagglutinin family protein
MFLLTWLACRFEARANPVGGTVTQGSATFNTSGSQFTINQTSPNAFINWQSFNIGVGETTTFNQPSANSIAWNQINDVNPSQILGNLNANGYVVLQNANGFYIGGQAAITTHGLIMTTASSANVNLSSGGPWSFNATPPTAKIQNYGQINITGGGTAFLIAADIFNGGTINAPNGHIGLYDGETVLVSTSPNGQGLNAEVTLPQGSVDNEGNLTANGGSVIAQAQFMNQNGIIQATSAQNVNGTIELVGSSSVTLGANSAISAQGGAQGVSSGGSVTIQAGNTFSDQPGSTIDVAGGIQGGNGGHVELSAPQMGAINTTINGQAVDGFAGGTLTIDPADIWLASADTDPLAPSGYSIINVNNYNGMSTINLQADDDIVLNTIWQLLDQSTPSTLSLTAGNNININDGSGISAGPNWTVNLTAGTGFVPTTGQPAPASGSDGIYLDGAAFIQAQNGNINLWAANEVQVGWANQAALPGQVNPGTGGITTFGGGNINVTTEYGDVNTGSNPNGYLYQAASPYTITSVNLGGISTGAGGNVNISAGGNVISYNPSGASSGDAGTGAFGTTESGNVTITAGGSVYGHYVLSDGTGTITAGENAGDPDGANFALSLIDSLVAGGWSVNAGGNIYLQEVRNPNALFNIAPAGRHQVATPNLFTYGNQDFVDLTAGNGVYLTDANLPRLAGYPVPVIYPSILDITAGAGGVTLDGNVTLFPSPYQNLSITTTDGGNLMAIPNALASNPNATGSNPELLMSDSSLTQWLNDQSFIDTDNGTVLPNDLLNPNPVTINISGSMENLTLITTKETDITVGGNMINCGFSGQNLQANGATSINVAGQIFNSSPYTFLYGIDIPSLPATDLPTGIANTWSDIFTLAVNTTALASLAPPASVNIPPSQYLAYALENASLFPVSIGANGQIVPVQSPGFVYDPTTGRLGYIGPMSQSVYSALSQQITVLHLVNGQPMINPATGQFETDTVTWVNPSVIATLFNNSQSAPLPQPGQLGYQIGGPGTFDITAGSISLGNTYGILSDGVSEAEGGLSRYGNLASLTPEGATINVEVTGSQQITDPLMAVGPDNPYESPLDMLTSTIATLGGGDVNVTCTSGSMDLGSQELFSVQRSAGAGIYTTGGGNVNLIAQGDVNIDGSRVGTYNGGNILVESLGGTVNIGSGGSTVNGLYVSYVNPITKQAQTYAESAYGSGIIANTLIPPLPGSGASWPPTVATVPGNITVLAPQGNIIASLGGVLQEALNGSVTAGPSVTLEAGTPAGGNWNSTQPPVYVGNINLGNSGVIGGNVTVEATGNILGQIISRQNTTVNAVGNITVTILSGGSANLAAGGDISGTIVGVSSVNISSGNVSAQVLSQNANVVGQAQSDTLGSSATATSSSQSAAQQSNTQSNQQLATDVNPQDNKKKKSSIQKVGHVTVILANAK